MTMSAGLQRSRGAKNNITSKHSVQTKSPDECKHLEDVHHELQHLQHVHLGLVQRVHHDDQVVHYRHTGKALTTKHSSTNSHHEQYCVDDGEQCRL